MNFLLKRSFLGGHLNFLGCIIALTMLQDNETPILAVHVFWGLPRIQWHAFKVCVCPCEVLQHMNFHSAAGTGDEWVQQSYNDITSDLKQNNGESSRNDLEVFVGELSES